MSESKCWLVVWNRKNLYVDKFFAEVGDGKTDFSVWLCEKWARLDDFKEGDKGIIVVVTEGDNVQRDVYATFVVTGNPKEQKDTHPQFWKDVDPDAEKTRALVRIDSSFPPICGDIAEKQELKIRPIGHWVCEKPMKVYHWVRKHAETASVKD